MSGLEEKQPPTWKFCVRDATKQSIGNGFDKSDFVIDDLSVLACLLAVFSASKRMLT
jgi:hypothetical protein